MTLTADHELSTLTRMNAHVLPVDDDGFIDEHDLTELLADEAAARYDRQRDERNDR